MTATRGNAPAGALAASLAAIEVQKLLSWDLTRLGAGHELLFEAGSRALFVTRLVRNPACRFSHERWNVSWLPDLALRDALELTGPASSGSRLGIPGDTFVTGIECPGCGLEERPWRLRGPLGSMPVSCPRCGVARAVRGFDLADGLSTASVPPPLLERPLSERGLRPAEVFCVEADRRPPRYFALEGPDFPYPRTSGATVVVAGCGNIGSFLVPLLARMPGVGQVVLCDPDAYEAGQIAGQDMRTEDAGRNKAEAQAERLRALCPGLPVEARAEPVEALPLGALVGAVAVSCLDSRQARLRLAARAWRVGRAFVDAAVGGGESLMVRTDVYLPEAEAACFECAFEARDYESLEQVFPCNETRAA